MNIVILGAGELGRELAWTLCDKSNRVVVVDFDGPRLERLQERLDVMTVHGEAASVEVLKKAGVANASLFLAVTGSDATNVLACKIARHYGVAKTVCRSSSDHFFSEEDGLGASALGVDHLIFPEEDCVQRVMGVLNDRAAIERIAIPQAEAELCAFRICVDSPLRGLRLRAFPDAELLSRIRFALLLRNQQLVVPTGDQTFILGDEVYAAGTKDDMDALLRLAASESGAASLVIVAGATSISRKLIEALLADGKTVRVVENDIEQARWLMDNLGGKIMVLNGDPTEGEVLEDAGVENCHAFVGALRNDECNILSCVLAKKLGARKVVGITNKAEYVDIVPTMAAIDCGFSPRLVAVNSVLRLLSTETVRVHAILQRTHAYVYEFEVRSGAPVCNKRIAELATISSSIIVALVIRAGLPIPAVGGMVLEAGDTVVLIAPPRDASRLEKMFSKRGILSL